MKIKYFFILLAAAVFSCTLHGKTVKASSFGFDPADATAALQKAFDSGARRVIVDNMGKDWIVRPLYLRSNQEVIFQKGVTLRAKKGEFKRRTDCMFKLENVVNVQMRGEGNVTLIMNKKDYEDPKLYRYGQWRNTIALFGVKNVKISNLTLKSSGGDGIYITGYRDVPVCRDITIENVVCEDHYRQGMSVICVNGLVVRNCKFNYTGGTAPQCGVDFEPNRIGQGFENVLMENCEFSYNKRAGIMFCLELQKNPVSITVRNSIFKGNVAGVILNSLNSKGAVKLENCRFEEHRDAAVIINGQNENGLKFTMKNVTIDGLKSNYNAMIELRGGAADMGGICFDNVKVLFKQNSFMDFSITTGYGLTSFTGSLFHANVPGKFKPFDLKKFVHARRPDPSQRMSDPPRKVTVKNLVPITPGVKVAGTDYQVRYRFSFIQSVPSAGVWPIKLKGTQIGKRPYELRCIVTDKNGAVWDQFKTEKTDFTYNLVTKSGGGVFTFHIVLPGHSVTLTPVGNGQALMTSDLVKLFRGRNQRYYFAIPAEAEYAAVLVSATASEPVDAQILDARGKVVKHLKRIKSPTYIKVPRQKSAKDEIWSIRFPWVCEDFAFQVCPPSLPLAATAPENLLVEKK